MTIPDDIMKTAESLWGASVLDIARALVAEREASTGNAIPKGWLLAPQIPTEEMLKAWAADDGRPLAGVSWRELARYDWEAFLSAVPNPEAAHDG